MTSNQIRYAEHRENVRHNSTTEGIQTGTLTEASRHNVADEGIRWYTARSNNYIGVGQLGVAQGQLGVAQQQLIVNGFDAATRRLDAGTRQNELIVHQQQQESNYLNAKTQESKVQEDIRHNKKAEKQQDFRNVVEAIDVGGETLREITTAGKNIVEIVPGFLKMIAK